MLLAVGLFVAQAAAPVSSAPVVISTQLAPIVVAPVETPVATAILPANTQVTLAINDTISTKGNRWNEGDNFDLTVTHDVRLGQYVIIPRGSRGSGRITWLTNKGAFGKSGKMEIDIEYVEVGGRRIPLSGHYRQEGEGNTVATVGTAIAVGVFAGFVTGRSGNIPQGRELVARTKEDIPVAFAAPIQPLAAYATQPQVMSPDANPVVAVPATAQPMRRRNPNVMPQSTGRIGPNTSGVRCITCQ